MYGQSGRSQHAERPGETTVDLYGPELARQLGVTCRGLLIPDVGHTGTIAVRKDDTLHPHDAVHGHDSVVCPGRGRTRGGPPSMACAGTRARSAA